MSQPRTVPITLPELGTAARFSLWLVGPGEYVFEGDRIAEVIVPGATFDVSAPATGRLLERNVSLNEAIVTGQVLGLLLEDEGDA